MGSPAVVLQVWIREWHHGRTAASQAGLELGHPPAGSSTRSSWRGLPQPRPHGSCKEQGLLMPSGPTAAGTRG